MILNPSLNHQKYVPSPTCIYIVYVYTKDILSIKFSSNQKSYEKPCCCFLGKSSMAGYVDGFFSLAHLYGLFTSVCNWIFLAEGKVKAYA